MRYHLYNRTSGADLGVWDGETREEALAAMFREAGEAGEAPSDTDDFIAEAVLDAAGLYEEMTRYNRERAPGSECEAWGDYVADCYRKYEIPPWEMADLGTVISAEFSEYWEEVAAGDSDDYDPETGGRIE